MDNAGTKIFKAYRKATETVAGLVLYQDKMQAWQMVVDFCRDERNRRAENKTARDTVLFWTYNNMAALAAENGADVSLAAEYYHNSLPFAPGERDRVTVYRKLARLYRQSGDLSSWLEAVGEVVRKEEDLAKISACLKEAEHCADAAAKKKYLQQAWALAECGASAESRDCQLVAEHWAGAAREARAVRKNRERQPAPRDRRI